MNLGRDRGWAGNSLSAGCSHQLINIFESEGITRIRAFSSRGKLRTYDVELKERAVKKRGCTVLTDCRRRAAARIVILIFNT